jgi:di/tricarboxylate transporter
VAVRRTQLGRQIFAGGACAILIVLLIFVSAMVLLATNRVRIDVIGLGILVALGLTGRVPSRQLFAGFSSEPVLLIAAMLAMGEGLVRAGTTARLARWIQMWGGRSASRLVATLMVLSALPSGFVSDVGLVGIFLPVVKTISRRSEGVSARGLLLPLAVAATLGGLLTMVGSAGNIVGNEALLQAGYRPLGIFAITPLALLVLCLGTLFMVVGGRRIIRPGRAPLEDDSEALRAYVAELAIEPSSPLVGKSLSEVRLFSDAGLAVAAISRGGARLEARSDLPLAAGDRLAVVGDAQGLLGAGNQPALGLSVVGEGADGHALRAGGQVALAELLIGSRSPWAGHSLIELDARRRWGIAVLGLYRGGQLLHQHIAQTRLQVGDIILAQLRHDRLATLAAEHGLILLNEPDVLPEAKPYQQLGAPVALLGSLLLAAFGVVDIRLALALGVLLMTCLGAPPGRRVSSDRVAHPRLRGGDAAAGHCPHPLWRHARHGAGPLGRLGSPA